MTATLLFVGNVTGKNHTYVDALAKRYTLIYANSGIKASQQLEKYDPLIVVLDAISMHTPGYRVCKSIRADAKDIPIVHILDTTRVKGRKRTSANVTISPPIYSRHLIATIERLINPQKEKTISSGPFTLNIKQRTLVAYGKETHLTPKQAQLLEIFFSNPNEVIDRKRLMEEVWQTDYLGDTRTLNVHVRWLRELLEPDNKNPRYLKTVRGVGYQFELED